MPKLKKWIGERAGAVAALLFITSLVLYGVAFLIERGLSALSPATVTAAIATALLLASVSVTLERYIKASLTDPEIETVLRARELGLERIQERNVSQGLFTGLPSNILEKCRKELLVLAYSADNFIVRNRTWIIDSVQQGKHVGLLLLHPRDLEQSRQTERRDLRSQIETTLSHCENIVRECVGAEGAFEVRGYFGHFYYTGIFVDRYIFSGNPSSVHVGPVCVQLKANYRSQHEGIVLTFARDSRFADYYSASCRELWTNAQGLLGDSEETTGHRAERIEANG